MIRDSGSEAFPAEAPELQQEIRVGQRRDLSTYSRAYSKRVSALLRQIHPDVQKAATEFAASFYEDLSREDKAAAILGRLDAKEFAHLQRKQAQHLAFLFSPDLTVYEHYERAKHVGRIHEFVGLGQSSLFDAYHQYEEKIQRLLLDRGLDGRQQELLARALVQRLMLDMEAQTISYQEVVQEQTAAILELDKSVQAAGTLTDLLRNATRIFGGLDGILACLLSRPDAQGDLQIEAVAGNAGQSYVNAMRSNVVPLIQTDADRAAGQGPTGQAWRSAQTVVCDSFGKDPTLGPWRETGFRLGFRSMVAIPLLDESRQSFAVLNLYSGWPGFFVNDTRRAMLAHAQQALSHTILRFERGIAIPVRERETYRQYLRAGAVQMHYQPIIDLRNGKLRHIEALARLRANDGKLVPPAAFLPTFGSADLLHLFRLGLEGICRDCHSCEHLEGPPSVSINLPAEALTQDVYRDTLFEVLSREKFATNRIQLEILETSELVNPEKRDERIAEFREAGIRIVQDDLGSGHSSLLRMDHISFDAVKIDQGLVRNAINNPQRALEFIFHLTRLVHGFGIPVTVEGLEDHAMVEAVAILGADYGQGYAIGRPMPAFELPQWRERFAFDIDPRQPRTPLGALAGYLLLDHQCDALNQWPDLIEHLTNYPCLVHRYIDFHGLRGSELHDLLEKNLRASGAGTTHPAYQHSRNQLITLLANEWMSGRER